MHHGGVATEAKRIGDWLVEKGHITRQQAERAAAEQIRQPDVPFGQICVRLGFLTKEDLDHYLTRYAKRLPIGETLVRAGAITHDQLEHALRVQVETKERLGATLLRLGYVKEEQLGEALASQFDMPFLRLRSLMPEATLRAAINPVYASQNFVVPVTQIGTRLTVAITDPTSRQCVDDLTRTTRLTIVPILTVPSDLKEFYRRLYGTDLADPQFARRSPSEEDASDELEPGAPALVPAAGPSGKDATNGDGDEAADIDMEVLEEEGPEFGRSKYVVSMEDSPLVQTLVQKIIARALSLRASDIHLEADVQGPKLRYRVDGMLGEYSLGKDMDRHFRGNYRSILSRLKVLAHMDIAEKRRPQDAAFRMVVQRDGKKGSIDLRLSTIPCRFGEGLVIRVLDQTKAPASLESLGLSKDLCDAFRGLIQRPSGILLITGPTGSGKSSTLYGALRTLFRPELKILTVEDPIEYTHPGIVQAEVNTAIDNTFARFLRTFLRQDPDVIMVGEIRDGETAEMALRAAQTGHLLLSTLHTIDSTSAVQRLLDLHDDPNGLAMCLIGVMAQRLARMNCMSCSGPYNPPAALLREWYAEPPQDVVWVRGRGCPACNNTGYAGRTVIAELWVPSPQDAFLITKRSSSEQLRREALVRMRCLGESALGKATKGLTTLEEALRVVPYEDVTYLRNRWASRAVGEFHGPGEAAQSTSL